MTPSTHGTGRGYEHTTEAEAGVYLSSGERWWGTRVKWRYAAYVEEQHGRAA